MDFDSFYLRGLTQPVTQNISTLVKSNLINQRSLCCYQKSVTTDLMQKCSRVRVSGSGLFTKQKLEKFLDLYTNHPVAKELTDVRMFTTGGKSPAGRVREKMCRKSHCALVSVFGVISKINNIPEPFPLQRDFAPGCSKVTAHVNSKVQNCQQKQMKLLLRFLRFFFS